MMTPEQRLTHLKDADAWQIADPSPRHVAGPKPRARTLLEFAGTVAAISLAVVITLFAVATFNGNRSAQPAAPDPTATQLSTLPYITTEGLGDLLIDSAVSPNTTTAKWVSPPAGTCAVDGYWTSPDSDEQFYASSGTKTGSLRSVIVISPHYSTGNGLHVGSSLEDVESRYPDAEVSSTDNGTSVTVRGTSGQLESEIGKTDSGTKDVVVYIHVLPTGTAPVFAQHGGFGPCI